MTFLILVFSEIIPKTLGAVQAQQRAGFTGPATRMIFVSLPRMFVLEQPETTRSSRFPSEPQCNHDHPK
jgi:Mg2+/Co2+ transporter CorB